MLVFHSVAYRSGGYTSLESQVKFHVNSWHQKFKYIIQVHRYKSDAKKQQNIFIVNVSRLEANFNNLGKSHLLKNKKKKKKKKLAE